MRVAPRSLTVAGLVFVLAPGATLSSGSLAPETEGYCAEWLNRLDRALDEPGFFGGVETPTPDVSFVGDRVVVLEYPSVYDVHSSLDPTRDKRSQGGSFDSRSILEDLKPHVIEASYDFVLMYSLQEVPGWIHSGSQWNGAPARNIGQPHNTVGNGTDSGSWTRLRGTPHMNSVDLYDGWELFPGSDAGLLVPMHEMNHYWSVYWSQSGSGPREWRPGDPLAHLAGARFHWSWNWVDTIAGSEAMPGIMFSAPLSFEFNEFDLYAMGLMPYSELAGVRHAIYECAPPNYEECNPGDVHDLTVAHLLESLQLEGWNFFEGDGRRIPPTDPSVEHLNALIVVVKGLDDAFTPQLQSLISTVSENLPNAWGTATRGRSQLSTRVQSSAPEFHVGGTVNGLSGSGLVLRNRGGDDLEIEASGEFVFPTTVENGGAYAVSVAIQPDDPPQTCTVSRGTGVVDGTDVTEVAVYCRGGAGLRINAGLNDAWYDPATGGQGFFFTVYPEIELFFLSWFTYEVERPDAGVTATLGEPGHRWLTAFGPWTGNTAQLIVELSEGGVFRAPEPPVEQSDYGAISLVFHDCSNATLTYDLPSPGVSGTIELVRLAPDNAALCEALSVP